MFNFSIVVGRSDNGSADQTIYLAETYNIIYNIY